MELKLLRNPVFINEVILDETVEQPIECDALLPDYCPDIRRILKCTMTPVLMSRTVSAGRLELEGIAELNVLYVAAGGELARGEYKVPFTRMLELRGDGENPMVTVTLRPGQVNCRAVNQRRLDIRGSVAIKASGLAAREEQAVCGAGDEPIQLRRRDIRGVRPVQQTEKETALTTDTALSGSDSPVSRVLRTDARVIRREQKYSAGKLIVRGEVQAAAFYQSEAGSWGEAAATMPFETAMELPGASDDAPCEVWQEIVSVAAEPGADEDGEMHKLTWEVMLHTGARAYAPYAATICTDCYSTRFASAFRPRAIQTQQLLTLCDEAETYRDTLPLPEQTGEIAVLWLREEGCAVRPEGDGLTADARLTLTMLAKMSDGELYSFDRAIDLQHHLPAEEGAGWNARLECRGCQWEVRDGSVSVVCDLVWQGAVTRMAHETLAEDITVDEKQPRTDAVPRGLYIYMAQPGESLWEVARRYNTSEDKIREDNGDLTETCAGGAILIPV